MTASEKVVAYALCPLRRRLYDATRCDTLRADATTTRFGKPLKEEVAEMLNYPIVNLQLHHRVSDNTGVMEIRSILAIVAGKPEPEVLVAFRDIS